MKTNPKKVLRTAYESKITVKEIDTIYKSLCSWVSTLEIFSMSIGLIQWISPISLVFFCTLPIN